MALSRNQGVTIALIIGLFILVISFSIGIDGEELDDVCTQDDSFLYRFNGQWGCIANGSIINVNLNYTLINNTITQIILNTTFNTSSINSLNNTIQSQINVSKEPKINGLSSKGLRSYYPCDEDITDYGGDGNDLIKSVGNPTYSEGRFGSACESDGLANYRVARDTNEMILSEMTLMAWVYYEGKGSYVISKSLDWRFGFVGSPANFGFYTASGNTTGTGIFNKSVIPLHEWSHVVFTNNGSHDRLYINGILDNQEVGTGTPSDLYDLTIGSYSDTFSTSWNGSIDEASIWDRALSEREIKLHYESTRDMISNEAYLTKGATLSNVVMQQPKDNGYSRSELRGYWNANDFQDWGDNELITSQGTTTLDSGKIGRAWYFDGVDDNVQVIGDELSFNKTMTISMWVKHEEQASVTRLIYRYSGFGAYSISLRGGYIDFFTTSNLGANFNCISTGTNISDNQWHHVAVTYGTGGKKIYVDGKLDDTCTTWTEISAVGITTFFGTDSASNYDFKGWLDEIALWNETFTPQQIQAIYQSNTELFQDKPRRNSSSFDYDGTETIYRNPDSPLNLDGATLTGVGDLNIINNLSCSGACSYGDTSISNQGICWCNSSNGWRSLIWD